MASKAKLTADKQKPKPSRGRVIGKLPGSPTSVKTGSTGGAKEAATAGRNIASADERARQSGHKSSIGERKHEDVKTKPKPKGGVTNPKPDENTAKARAAGARPKSAGKGTTSSSEHEESGMPTRSPKLTRATSGKSNPQAASTARKTGATSPKKSGAVSPKVAGKNAPVRLVGGSPRNVSHLSLEKHSKTKSRSSPRVSAPEEENGEKAAAKKHQINRRKSVVAAALARIRRTLRPDQVDGSKSDTETTLSSKDQMSLFLVWAVAAFLFVFMAILMFVFFLGGTNIPEGVACITDECQEAKQYLDSLLNDTRDPCTDFYGYVCGSWQAKGGSFHGDASIGALFRLNTTLLHTRIIKRKEEIRQGMHLLRPIYSSCYRYMSKPAQLKDALIDAQNYLDISQLMKASSFFDVVRYLVRQSLQVGVYTLFHVRFIYEAGRPLLYVTEGYTLAEKLGQSFDSGDAQETFARVLRVWLNVSDVDAQMALLKDVDAGVSQLFATGSRSEEQMSLRDAVANMFPGVSAEDWVAAVSASQRHRIVLVPTDDILTRGSEIYKPATQLVVNYGLRNATFYLATNLEADVLYVLSTHKKILKNDVSKGFYCLGFTHKCLALTWAYLAARLLAPIGSTGVIFNILKFMNEIVHETDQVLSWMKNTTAVKAKEVVSKTLLDVVAGEGFNVSRVDYSGPEPPLDESDPFLKNLVVALRHHHAVMAANPPTRLEVLISDLEFSSYLSYVPEKKAILVPTLYQNNPYLYPFRVPDFFNYGTLAVIIARVLIADVVGTSAGSTQQDSWDNVTRVKHAEVMSCLAQRRASLGFGDLNPVSGAQQKALILTLTMSVRLAYYALMKTFRLKAGTAKVFNDYWPAAEEVFFARFCLLWCSASNDANLLTPRERCMLPLYNMEEFIDHYSCKSRANFSAAPFCKV